MRRHEARNALDARCPTACPCGTALTRRRALQASGAAVATGTLAACGGDGTDAGPGQGSDGPAPSSDGRVRVPLADTPVGGSTYYQDEEIIVSQPREGEVVVFDATCTHQGCMVSETGAEGTLVCPCHNSVFDSGSGEVLSGPADGPLGTRTAEVDGADVVISG